MSKRTFQIIVGVLILMGWGLAGAYGIPSARLDSLTNYPNPFDSRKASTFIAYELESDADVFVRVYDLFGISVKKWQMLSGQEGARSGTNRLRWDGRNDRGNFVSAGGYICQVIVESGSSRVQGIRKIGVIH